MYEIKAHDDEFGQRHSRAVMVNEVARYDERRKLLQNPGELDRNAAVARVVSAVGRFDVQDDLEDEHQRRADEPEERARVRDEQSIVEKILEHLESSVSA